MRRFFQIFGVLALLAVLALSFRGMLAARSQVDCALRIIGGAPPGDQSPPAMYGRLAQAFWQHRDLFLARTLARECAADSREGLLKVRM